MEREPTSLEPLLDRIDAAEPEGGKVSLDAILDEVGHRSFGPLLLLAGLVTVAPVVGDIPGVPTIMGIFIGLTAVQLLMGRDHFWLPDWLLRRSVAEEKLDKAVGWLRRPARFVDRWLHPRLTGLVGAVGTRVIAVISLLIALALPPMEVVPFSANGAGLALTSFGLALITRDGLLAVIAFVVTAATIGLVLYNLL